MERLTSRRNNAFDHTPSDHSRIFRELLYMLPCTYDTVVRLVCGTTVCMRGRGDRAPSRYLEYIQKSRPPDLCQIWLAGGCSVNHPVADRFGVVIARATARIGIVHHVKHSRLLVSWLRNAALPATIRHEPYTSLLPAALQGCRVDLSVAGVVTCMYPRPRCP